MFFLLRHKQHTVNLQKTLKNSLKGYIFLLKNKKNVFQSKSTINF